MTMRSRILALSGAFSLLMAAVVGLPFLVNAATLTLSVSTSISGLYRGSNDLGSPVYDLSTALQPPIAFATGTGTQQVNLLFADQRTLAPSATEGLDLAGSLTDPLGSTLTFAQVKVIKICAASGNTNDVDVGGSSSAPSGMFGANNDKIAVRPGGCFVWVAPKTGSTVTASTGDILLIGNSSSGTGVTYDVIIAGTSS